MYVASVLIWVGLALIVSQMRIKKDVKDAPMEHGSLLTVYLASLVRPDTQGQVVRVGNVPRIEYKTIQEHGVSSVQLEQEQINIQVRQSVFYVQTAKNRMVLYVLVVGIEEQELEDFVIHVQKIVSQMIMELNVFVILVLK